MNSKWIPIILVGLFLFVSGCETAKGFTKDVENSWTYLKQADDWMKENMW